MSSYEDDIAGALIRGEDAETAINRAALRFAVARQIMCRRSGVVLDMRTAVLITVTNSSGKSGSECIDGRKFDEIADELRGRCEQTHITLEVIDGRELHK